MERTELRNGLWERRVFGADDLPAIGADPLGERKTWGMTMLDQLWCRISFKRHRYDGEFTPPGLEPSLQYPGPLGGLNWGSVSIDPLNHIAFMNDARMASSRTLVRRGEYAQWAVRHREQGLDAHGTGLQALRIAAPKARETSAAVEAPASASSAGPCSLWW